MQLNFCILALQHKQQGLHSIHDSLCALLATPWPSNGDSPGRVNIEGKQGIKYSQTHPRNRLAQSRDRTSFSLHYWTLQNTPERNLKRHSPRNQGGCVSCPLVTFPLTRPLL